MFSIRIPLQFDSQALGRQELRDLLLALQSTLMTAFAPVDIGGSLSRGEIDIWLTVKSDNEKAAKELALAVVRDGASKERGETPSEDKWPIWVNLRDDVPILARRVAPLDGVLIPL